MKQFVNLSPTKSMVVRTSSDQPDVEISAFAGKDTLVVQVLNAGPERDALISGLAGGSWHTVTTTESSGFQEAAVQFDPGSGARKLHLAARSLTTLVRE